MPRLTKIVFRNDKRSISANVKNKRWWRMRLHNFGHYCLLIVIFSAFLFNNKGVVKHDTLQKQNKWKNQNY